MLIHATSVFLSSSLALLTSYSPKSVPFRVLPFCSAFVPYNISRKLLQLGSWIGIGIRSGNHRRIIWCYRGML
ncbi:hypothetical protein BJ878DRAFT_522074, partial [Calycina marina]